MRRWHALARPSFHVVAAVEASTWVGLLGAMAAHYLGGASRAGIELFGPLHGAAFIAYLAVAVAASRALRWSPPTLALALAASVPPLCTALFDLVGSRRGWLDRRPHRDPLPARG